MGRGVGVISARGCDVSGARNGFTIQEVANCCRDHAVSAEVRVDSLPTGAGAIGGAFEKASDRSLECLRSRRIRIAAGPRNRSSCYIAIGGFLPT